MIRMGLGRLVAIIHLELGRLTGTGSSHYPKKSYGNRYYAALKAWAIHKEIRHEGKEYYFHTDDNKHADADSSRRSPWRHGFHTVLNRAWMR
jgi:hypothetical protein